MLYNHRSVTVPVALRNSTNRGTGEKEGINGRKIEMEWINRKDCCGFCDGWDFFLLAIIVPIILINIICCNFDC